MTKTLVIGAALALGGSALGQLNRPLDITPVNISVRGGVALPIDSALSDVGSPLIALGFEYQLTRSLLGSGETYFALDYFTPSFRGDRGSVIPVTLNQRFYTGDRGFGRRTYAFVGLGVSFIDVEEAEAAFAVRGGIGAELGDRLFYETALFLSDKAGGVRGNSINFYLGYRF